MCLQKGYDPFYLSIISLHKEPALIYLYVPSEFDQYFFK